MSCTRGLPAWGRRTLRRRAVLIDVIAAAGLTGGALWAVATLTSDHWVPITAASAVVCTTTVAWRRRAPALAAFVALTAVIVYQRVGDDTQGAFITAGVVLTCYSVGGRGTDHRHRRSLAFVLGYALAACTVISADSGFSVFGVALTWVPVAVLPAAAGLVVERRERSLRDLVVAESRLRREQEVRAARVVAEERTRVARELHDVVAHCVSVMVIQAGAARLVAGSDATAARDALRAVVSSGRDALADLRRVVGVLRRGDDSFASAAVGLAQVELLMERLRIGGLQVGVRVVGERVALPTDLDLTAFRIVQEALTNVVKHAPSARVDVSISYGGQDIEVRVEDAGPADPATTAPVPGHGLVGMRERVALHGGELRAGPTACGGFMVHARLPLIVTASPPTPVAATAAPISGTPSSSKSRWTPQAVDAVFAGVWLVALETEALTSPHRSGPLAVNVAAAAVMALAGVIRRRAPLAFLAVVGALTIALSGGIASPGRATVVGTYTLFVAGYTIAAYQPRNRALAGLCVMLAGVVGATVLQHAPAGVAFGGGMMTCLIWMVGRLMRQQRELTSALEDAAARLAVEREDRALLALYDERARIARDLHTLVARLVTTMVIQSDAAGELVGTGDPRAASSIRAIEQTGRQAMMQMRQMLGVLRSVQSPLSQTQPVATPVPIQQVVLEAVPS